VSSSLDSAATPASDPAPPAEEPFALDALLGDSPAAEVLRAVLDGVEEGIVACDAAGVLCYANGAARSMHGFPEPRLPAEPTDYYELVQTDGVTALAPERAPFLRALREGRFEGAELIIVPRHGAARRLSTSGRAICGRDGAVLGAVVWLRDLRDRKDVPRHQEQLQLSQLAAVLATASEGILAADALGRVIEWNAAALAIHDFGSSDEAPRQLAEFSSIFEVRAPSGELLPVEQWPMTRALRGETFSRMELSLRHAASGWEKQLSYGGACVRGDDGRVILGLLTIRDITARRFAEEQLEHNQRQMEIVVQGANVGVWYCPLPFDRLIWDATVKDHFHLPPEAEVTIDIFYERLHPEDREPTRQAIELSIATRESYDIEYRTVSPDGANVKWIRARGRGFYDAAGAPRRFDGITIDITANKRAEMAARDSERRFREMADTAPSMLWVTEPDGYCSFLSRGWYEFTGQSFEEGQGFGWTLAVHPDDREAAGAAFRDANASRNDYAIDFRLRRADGAYRWVIDTGRPRYGQDGEFLGFVGCVIDVHGRKEAEAQLREGEARLRLAIDIAQLGTFDIDLATDAVTVNDLGRRIYGWNAETQLTFARVQTHFHPGDTARVLAEVQAALSPDGTGELDIEQRIVRTDGAVRSIRVRARAEFEGVGVERRGTRLVGTYLDITERKESEERFRQVANSIPQLAWVARPDGWVLWYNDRWYEYTAARPEEMEGHGWHGLVEPEALPAVMQRWQTSIASGHTFDMTFAMRGADGIYRPFLMRVAPVHDSFGNLALWFGTNTDISEQQRLLAERQQLLASEKAARERAEEEGRLKDEFLATLSHELRTPLNAILGWSTMMRGGTLNEKLVRDGVQVIERNARAQAKLIEDLLDMSRIISGRIPLDVQPVDLTQLVDAACEAVKPGADAKGVRMEKVVDAAVAPLLGDPIRLQQVAWNLLNNAVKFTPRGGWVRVRLERTAEEARLVVEDSGEGIRPDFLPHVFDRFRQADGTTKRRHGGLGLGLAIVKQLVELHGGEVSASSEGVGLGARFVVSLPASLGAAAPESGEERPSRVRHATPAPLRPAASRLSGVRVLVVDDEPDARELVQLVLEECGAVVAIAASAPQALEALRRSPPAVLVSDIGMPGMDGYDLIRRVRELGPAEGGTTPALALTAFARGADRARALEAGYQAHLTKPAEPAQLVTLVAELAGTSTRR
jgi:PAS domain S-box-containing protein